MNRRMITAALAAAAAAALAGCAGSPPRPHASQTATAAAAHTTPARETPAGSPAPAAPPAADTLACSTLVDPEAGLTAKQVIADLEAMLLIDGAANLPAGTPSQDDTQILETAALDLENYSGTRLASDAAQFAADEQDYDPSGTQGGPYTSYAHPLGKDILVLANDCHTAKEAVKLAGL